MPKLYRAADAFALIPDSSEAFGLVYLEAMATNLPVMTIDDSVRRNIVGNAGVFVKDHKDVSEVADSIKELFKTDFGSKPRKRASHYDWDSVVSRYEKLFNDSRS